MNPFRLFVILAALCAALSTRGDDPPRQKLNFNGGWRLHVGDVADGANPQLDDSRWRRVVLPFAYNQEEAFARDITDLTTGVAWYRKHFTLNDMERRKAFLEFEGMRQGGEVWLNGKRVGASANGVMASGYDLTPYIINGENVVAVRIDNSWDFTDPGHGVPFQWNNRNFNANYGGLPKNVFLHLTGLLYQTLPLYSNLGTTGVYVYATDIDTEARTLRLHIEAEVRNDGAEERMFTLTARIDDAEGRCVGTAHGQTVSLGPGQTVVAKAETDLRDVHLWSWGYGYLYTVSTTLATVNSGGDMLTYSDLVTTRTGFRKTQFAEGKIWLNDRVIMMHGYAQRTSNEWPATGLSVPAWMSDYSNRLMVEGGANIVRWMHVTPWKQDVESCDRVGLPQAMPAGDAEKDVEGPRWEQRVALMRDAIIYNRNNPSILFYESGNESISREHIMQMKALRDEYDPHGGRAVGSREMLDIDEAEYGGEMLYINKSAKHPMWAMEYCRDEGLRKYWDEKSFPWHREGDGPLYRGKPALEYNHDMDALAVEMVRRWYDYWLERPGTGKRVSSGGAKIVFSDTNTHHRGESNYRTSGVVDAMRIPKDAFFANQVMWTGWVDDEEAMTHIVGHWNYDRQGPQKDAPKVETVTKYVVSNSSSVELFLNGQSLGKGRRSHNYLFTFDNIPYQPGTLCAVGYDDNGEEESSHEVETAGPAHHIALTVEKNPLGMKADGADMAIVTVEVVDENGRRCPLDNRTINFTMIGEGRWLGGIATRDNSQWQQPDTTRRQGLLDTAATRNLSDNFVGARSLPVECGVNAVMVGSTEHAGTIIVYASADGLQGVAKAEIPTEAVDTENYLPALMLEGWLGRGETPREPSYEDTWFTVPVVKATGADGQDAAAAFDDNELSEWQSNGDKEQAAVTFQLGRKAKIGKVVLKLTGWRNKRYPLAVFAGNKKVWEGITPTSLGYVHLNIEKPEWCRQMTVKMTAPAQDSSGSSDQKELAGGNAGELDRSGNTGGKVVLRIVEADFLEAAE